MKLNRRQALTLSAGAAVAVVAGIRTVPAYASAEDTEKRIMEFTGGKTPESGKIDADGARDRGERQHRADLGQCRERDDRRRHGSDR